MTGYIYKITNIENNKCYIGQTTRDVELRWKEHIKYAVGNSPINRHKIHEAIRESGVDNFLFEKIKEVNEDDIDSLKRKLDEFEIYYIDKYKSFYNGYNCTFGGDGVPPKAVVLYSFSGDVIKKYYSLTMAAYENNLSLTAVYNCCMGIHKSSICGIFRFKGDDFNKYEHDPYYRKDGNVNIISYDENGNIKNEYNSEAELAREVGVTKTTVSRWVKSHVYVENIGYLFKREETFNKDILRLPALKKVEAYDINNNFIGLFESCSDAARKLGLDASTISKCCLGKLKSYKNYIFKYV